MHPTCIDTWCTLQGAASGEADEDAREEDNLAIDARLARDAAKHRLKAAFDSSYDEDKGRTRRDPDGADPDAPEDDESQLDYFSQLKDTFDKQAQLMKM